MAWEWLEEAIGSRSLGALKAGAVGSYHGRNNPDFWSEEEKAGWNVFERALYDPERYGPEDPYYPGGQGRGSGLPFGMSDIDVRLEGEGLLPSTIYVGEEGYRRPLPSGSTTDLAAHYDISRQLADRFGKIPAASMGLYQEIQNKISGSPGQFSLDDLLANYAGYMGITPEQAAERVTNIGICLDGQAETWITCIYSPSWYLVHAVTSIF